VAVPSGSAVTQNGLPGICCFDHAQLVTALQERGASVGQPSLCATLCRSHRDAAATGEQRTDAEIAGVLTRAGFGRIDLAASITGPDVERPAPKIAWTRPVYGMTEDLDHRRAR
jgi:hypothetical protein